MSRMIGVFCVFLLFVTLFTSCSVATDEKAPEPSQSKSQQAQSLYTPTSPMPESFYHASPEELKRNFMSPPDAVKPWVYWYWINDHISKTGIENDLAAMQRAGIGAALIGIIHLNPNNGAHGSVQALSEEWWDHLRFAIKKADEYNIDIGLFNSPGWSQSGGPWVDLDQSMRYLDSTEYQLSHSVSSGLHLTKPEGFSQNVKVLAFKTPQHEKSVINSNQTSVTVRDGLFQPIQLDQSAGHLLDGTRSTVFKIPSEVFDRQYRTQDRWSQLHIDFVHETDFDARTLEIYPHDPFSVNATLLAKNEQGNYVEIESFQLQRPQGKANIGPDHDAPIVVNFPKVTAKEFRLSLKSFNKSRKQEGASPGIKDIVLSSGYKLERYVEKKLAKVFPRPQPKYDSYLWPKPGKADDPSLVIEGKEVLDVTQYLKGNTLNWAAPDGQWTVVHYYMRSTGTTNGPSSKHARGPEIDKLSKPIAQMHFDAYVGKVIDSMKPEDRQSLKYLVVDSYEQGAQNWTDNFIEKFENRYGYDPIPFMPVYTGRVVNSAEQSERFLWDVRRLVADKVSYEYTAGLRERAHDHGLKLWLENYGHWGFPGEFLQYGGQADIVSGEFWASGNLGAIELKAASSAAHIYGHKTVMSESFTAGRSDAFKNHPWKFKKRGDWSFVEGVNHTLLHVYIQQAYDDLFPGVTAWFGSEFNRHNTWFDYMGTWLDYVKRANYMMQQGQYVADIMYFIGDDAPKMTGDLTPAVPNGYSYDFINSEVILNRVRAEEGEFVLPDGMRFKLMVLPNLTTMRPGLLKKIKQLVADGGAIYGPRPIQSPSLEDFPHADQQVLKTANEVWQKIDGVQTTHAKQGKGHVFYSADENVDLASVLKQLKRVPDLVGLSDSVIWSHRTSKTHDFYFIANQSESSVDIRPSFRLNNRMGHPQRWNAVSGETASVAQFYMDDERLTVPMTLQGLESTFVVFEKNVEKPIPDATPSIVNISVDDNDTWLPSEFDHEKSIVIDLPSNGEYNVELTNGQSKTITLRDMPKTLPLSNSWDLVFEKGRDVKERMTLDALVSLTELEPSALKHYSGSIRYQNHFQMNENLLRSDQRWLLDLGKVGVIARVHVNGQNLGDLWSRPMQLDVTDALVPGKNTVEIVVVTTWLNRLIGDKKYPKRFLDAKQKKAFETHITFQTSVTKKNQLQPSGLIGPVVLKPLRRMNFFKFGETSSLVNELTENEKKLGFRLLWDGKTFRGWRDVRTGSISSVDWTIEDGQLKVVPQKNPDHKGPPGGLITDQVFGDFELELEFKIEKGQNSGIKYYVDPELVKERGLGMGLEYQLLDDKGSEYASMGTNGNRTLASAIDLFPPKPLDNPHAAVSSFFRGVGTWNKARIVSRNGIVEHWLNDEKVVQFDRRSQHFKTLVQHSMHSKWPNYGTIELGHILLQDFDGDVSFRSIKIREF